jgi:hypothetical protein
MKLTDITVTRTIPASSDKVFDLWMNPKSPGGPWFGAERVILNPLVDGLFYIAVKHEERIWPHYGRLYGALFVKPSHLLTSSVSNSRLLRSILSEDPRGARRRGQHLRRVLVSGWIRAGSRP